MIYDKLLDNIGFTDEMKLAYDRYYQIAGRDIEPYCRAYMIDGIAMEDVLTEIHKFVSDDISEYTLDLLFVLGSTSFLYHDYIRAGISEKIFFDSMKDITYKINECLRIKNVFGIFVVYWYDGFFKLSRVALGRLQYDFNVENKEVITVGKYKILPGDFVVSCHIPSSGPLTSEMCVESYKMAYEFFSDSLTKDFLPVLCHSWMLYPNYKDLFEIDSNLYKFVSDFDVISTDLDEKFYDAWRIFGMEYNGDWAKFPVNTSLQKSFVQYIKGGGLFGHGKGVLLIGRNGEKIDVN